MAPQNAGFVRRWQSQGMEYLEPSQGLEALASILAHNGGANDGMPACVGAFPVADWGAFAASPHTPKPALVAELTKAASSAIAGASAAAAEIAELCGFLPLYVRERLLLLPTVIILPLSLISH